MGREHSLYNETYKLDVNIDKTWSMPLAAVPDDLRAVMSRVTTWDHWGFDAYAPDRLGANNTDIRIGLLLEAICHLRGDAQTQAVLDIRANYRTCALCNEDAHLKVRRELWRCRHQHAWQRTRVVGVRSILRPYLTLGGLAQWRGVVRAALAQDAFCKQRGIVDDNLCVHYLPELLKKYPKGRWFVYNDWGDAPGDPKDMCAVPVPFKYVATGRQQVYGKKAGRMGEYTTWAAVRPGWRTNVDVYKLVPRPASNEASGC